jgi:hypothetical protein
MATKSLIDLRSKKITCNWQNISCQQFFFISKNSKRGAKNITHLIQTQIYPLFYAGSLLIRIQFIFFTLIHIYLEFMLRCFVCWTQIFRFRHKFITITPQFSESECIETKHSFFIYTHAHILLFCRIREEESQNILLQQWMKNRNRKLRNLCSF